MNTNIKGINLFCFSLICVLLFSFVGCTSQQSILNNAENLSDDEKAQATLLEFLNNLHDGKYDEAARLYGGSYQPLIDQNPAVDPMNHETLWQSACTMNGMQCLQAIIMGMREEVPSEKYLFLVEFIEQDGTLYKLGPCCGADEPGSPPQSVFLFKVIRIEGGKFTVLDMPTYAP